MSKFTGRELSSRLFLSCPPSWSEQSWLNGKSFYPFFGLVQPKNHYNFVSKAILTTQTCVINKKWICECHSIVSISSNTNQSFKKTKHYNSTISNKSKNCKTTATVQSVTRTKTTTLKTTTTTTTEAILQYKIQHQHYYLCIRFQLIL